MYKSFNQYILKTIQLTDSSSILLAISGGADSVAMLNLFSKTVYKCGIAHCNFHLRGSESDKDEQLVKNLAKKYNYPFYKIDFDTEIYADENGISIEMAARELRYNWFEKIRKNNNYTYTATAHHKDDVIETFFINLARGTGIRGLSGIKAVTGNIIRPIIFADRELILHYVEENKLNFREDSSNNDVKYKRNKLRHDIIPEFAAINPAYKQNIIKTIERLNITNQILKEKITEVKEAVIREENNQLLFNISKLKQLNHLSFYLFELLQPYGFNSHQVESILESIDGISGKCFYSSSYQLIKDRDHLIIASKNEKPRFLGEISENHSIITLSRQVHLRIISLKKIKNFKIPHQQNIAVLDKDILDFPLEVRNWQKGDFFYPIGMNKKKKISDFFIDNKFTKIEKDQTPLLVSNGEIVWIIGHRLDNRFKITDKTKNIFYLSLEK